MLQVVDGPPADVGVIGGTGLYSVMADVTEVQVDTPVGPAQRSAPRGRHRGETGRFRRPGTDATTVTRRTW